MIYINRLQNPNVLPASLILLAGLLLVLFPHFYHLPVWLSSVMLGLLFWRACYDLQLCAIPNKIILFILTLMLIAGIFFSYHTIIGRDAGSALLLGLLCLKLFEIKSFRDVALIINLALFSIVINFLFNQTILVAAIMIFALLFLFTALIGFQHNYQELSDLKFLPLKSIQSNEKQHFKLAFKMLAQALPFAIVLFIFFPRVDGPLWGLPEDAFSGTTGLSDKMSPGRISQLSNNTSVAFRVKFNSAIPSSNKLYWRGPVMWNFNGHDWTSPLNERLTISSFKFTALGKKYSYAVTLQPHNNYWMFALDLPATLPELSRFSANMQLLSTSIIQKLKRYEISSYARYILPAYKQIPLQRYLQLPDSITNEAGSTLYKSKELISTLKDSSNPKNTVNNVLNYFATQNFYYSRTPPLLYNDPVDEFLFESKRGYCEHYASSFTILMRLAGIPARVVTGYQGGEINPIDNYMTIRQSDAHAWSEVYLGEKEGWARVDPTASIPLENIENANDALRLNSNLKKPDYLFKSNWITKQLKQMRFAWGAVNNRWNQWVLGYNNNRQKAFFAAIGIPEITWKGLSQLLFLILSIFTGILAFMVFSKKPKNQDKVVLYYSKFLYKLKKHDLIKKHTEGANDFCQRAINKLPQHKHLFQQITLLYQQLRYSNLNDVKLNQFKKIVLKSQFKK